MSRAAGSRLVGGLVRLGITVGRDIGDVARVVNDGVSHGLGAVGEEDVVLAAGVMVVAVLLGTEVDAGVVVVDGVVVLVVGVVIVSLLLVRGSVLVDVVECGESAGFDGEKILWAQCRCLRLLQI